MKKLLLIKTLIIVILLVCAKFSQAYGQTVALTFKISGGTVTPVPVNVDVDANVIDTIVTLTNTNDTYFDTDFDNVKYSITITTAYSVTFREFKFNNDTVINTFIYNISQNSTIFSLFPSDSIYLIFLDFNDNTNDCYIKVKVKVTKTETVPSAGIEDNLLDNIDLSIYPIPAIDFINVDFVSPLEDLPVSVYSMSGALVYTNTDKRIVNGSNTLKIDLYDIQSGTYLVKIGNTTKRIIKL